MCLSVCVGGGDFFPLYFLSDKADIIRDIYKASQSALIMLSDATRKSRGDVADTSVHLEEET